MGLTRDFGTRGQLGDVEAFVQPCPGLVGEGHAADRAHADGGVARLETQALLDTLSAAP